jgi:uncharacterized membrane protein YdfJ with MMPL/SSD domain
VRVTKVADVRDVRSPLGRLLPRRSRRTGTRLWSSSRSAATRKTPPTRSLPSSRRSPPRSAPSGFTIGEFGDASAEKGVVEPYDEDLGKAGALSLPITLIVLVPHVRLARRGGHPLLLALDAVFATFGLVAVSSLVLPVAMQAPAMVLLIGLAVGVDYSMFYLKRERQERAAGAASARRSRPRPRPRAARCSSPA